MKLKNIIKIFILIIFLIIFIILNIYKSEKSIFEDIVILGFWSERGQQYEVTTQDSIEIDVFSTINGMNKKIAPGSKGSFEIKFKRPINLDYKIQIHEKTEKPYNLFFMLDDKKYSSIESMEDVINKKFKDTEKITINWEWKYHIDNAHDLQDTKDGEIAQTYLFEIQAIVEEQERTKYEV